MTHTMFRTLSAASFAALLLTLAPMHAVAQTEDPCANETGAAYGLCIAYCDAMDCDGDPNADPTACERVAANFGDHADGRVPPCEVPPVACPCVDLAFSGVTWTTLVDAPEQIATVSVINSNGANIVSLGGVSGTTNYTTTSVDCTDTQFGGCNSAFGFVSTACGISVTGGNPPTSSMTGFTAAEAQACNQLLLDAACSDTSPFNMESYCQ